MEFLKTEIQKNFKIKLWQGLFLLCIIEAILKAYNFASNLDTSNVISHVDPLYNNAYFVFYRLYFSLTGKGFLLVASILSYSTIVFLEDRQNMMIFHATRSYFFKFHIIKLVSIYLFTAVFLMLSFFSSIIGIKLFFNMLPTIYTDGKAPSFAFESILFFKFFICAIGAISLNYLIVLFWHHKKSRLIASLTVPYLLYILLPALINPYRYLIFNANAAFIIRQNSKFETDYNLTSINLFTEYEFTAFIYFALVLLLMKIFLSKLKFLNS